MHARTQLDPGEPELAAVHIFRFEDGRIAELWNVVAPVPEDSPLHSSMGCTSGSPSPAALPASCGSMCW